MRRLTFFGVLAYASVASADQFDAIDGKAILAATRSPDAKLVARLTIADLGAAPAVLPDTRSTLLLAVTSRGNVARMLVVPELRKSEGGGDPVPVIVIERVDAFDAADLSARVARGRDLVVYPGFQVDLDTAQVVPAGFGADLTCPADTPGSLVPFDSARLFVPVKGPTADRGNAPQPTPGRAVVPTDFAGRYRLFANGQWSGTLDLTVGPDRDVTGRFRSDAQGKSYPVSGRVDPAVAHHLTLAITFPRARGELDGYLWTEGKGAIAGTFRLLDQPAGFFAIREGGRFGPDGVEVTIPAPGPARAGETRRPPD